MGWRGPAQDGIDPLALEADAQSKLNDTVAGTRVDLAGGRDRKSAVLRGTQSCAGIGQVEVVKRVDEIRAERCHRALTRQDVLQRADIPIPHARAPEDIAPGISPCPGERPERRRIEPLHAVNMLCYDWIARGK